MKISSEGARPHGLENAIQRVQANMDRRAARAKTETAEGARVPGANALASLQANLARKTGTNEPQPTPAEPLPLEPIAEPAEPDSVAPMPAPTPGSTPLEPAPAIAPVLPTSAGGLDILA